MGIVHKSNYLGHKLFTHAMDLENSNINIMLVWYEFPDGTISGYKVLLYDMQLKTSGSQVLFL